MIVYFSGTGNSRWCARVLAEALGDELRDAAGYIGPQIAAELLSDKPFVFVCPVYAWQMPRVFADFIRSGWFQGSRDAYLVLTCGSDSGAAGAQAAELFQSSGLNFRGAGTVVLPNNYILLSDAPGPEEARELLAAARPGILKLAERIREGKDLPMDKPGLLDRLKSGPINRGFYRYALKPGALSVTAARCVGCGTCARLCPLQNLRMEEGRPVWGERCTQCMACLNGCPVGAIECGKATEGRRRYRFPEEKAGE